jgi:hypothetical protein
MKSSHTRQSIAIIIIATILALLFGFFWHTKTSSNSNNQAWATYTQRLDSGDVISIDYPTGLIPAYGPYYGPGGEWKVPVYLIHLYSHDTAKSPADIVITQSSSVSAAQIISEKSAWEAQHDMAQSQWHLGDWTAYESSIPSSNGSSLDDFYFNINNKDLSMEISASGVDIKRIMSSIKLNGVQMSKLDSMQNWDWPALKTGK